MSTNDVPGANPSNGDDLHAGCWAEHSDGSRIFVEGAEGGSVIYSVFDMSKDPPVEYRDAMDEKGFKKQFTKAGWTWHDKTPFPWADVMGEFDAGSRLPSVAQTLTAAEQLAQRRSLAGEDMDEDRVASIRGVFREIGSAFKRLQDQIEKLPL